MQNIKFTFEKITKVSLRITTFFLSFVILDIWYGTIYVTLYVYLYVFVTSEMIILVKILVYTSDKIKSGYFSCPSLIRMPYL